MKPLSLDPLTLQTLVSISVSNIAAAGPPAYCSNTEIPIVSLRVVSCCAFQIPKIVIVIFLK